MLRTNLFSRSALGLALAIGTVAGTGFVSAPALAAKKPEAPKLAMSKPFQALAAPLQKAIDEGKARPDVVAAKQKAEAARTALNAAQGATAKAQARTAYDAALAELGATMATEKGQLDTAFNTIANNDDRYVAGQFAVSLGGVLLDNAIQRRGLAAMVESGKIAPADQPRMNFYLGQLAYDAKDYATARTALAAATAAGYHDNDADALLADAYLVDNQVPQGLQMLKKAIADAKSRGVTAPQSWYRRGLGMAYRNKLSAEAAEFSYGLVEAHPSTDNWAGAITIVRELGRYQPQETLDLMRLMDRTNSFSEERDYVEYIQAADARRSPGEVMKVINLGMAAKKLNMSDIFVSESRNVASGRVAADKASLPGLERDARAGSASGTTVMAAADAYLSYDDFAKAADLYQIALGKPGVDLARANTRLGIAQVGLGQYAEAQATFAKVDGPRKPLAQLWALFAAQKTKPAA